MPPIESVRVEPLWEKMTHLRKHLGNNHFLKLQTPPHLRKNIMQIASPESWDTNIANSYATMGMPSSKSHCSSSLGTTLALQTITGRICTIAKKNNGTQKNGFDYSVRTEHNRWGKENHKQT